MKITKIFTFFGAFLVSSFIGLHVSAMVNLQTYTDGESVPHWAEAAFSSLIEEDIISGNDNGFLNPNATINRAEFTKILLGATNKKLITPAQPSFNDVSANQWFYPYIETAANLGWVTGYNNGDFKPGNSINRAEIAKLINQAFELDAKVESSDLTWYDAEVRALEANNLLPYNVEKSNFEAAVTPTRAEAFHQIFRALPESKTTNSNAEADLNTEPEALFTTPETFTPVEKEAKAGDLNVSGLKNKEITLSARRKEVTLSTYNLQASKGGVRLEGLQLRRIGNGKISNYESLWLEANNQKITTTVTPNDDLVVFNFTETSVLSNGQTLSIQLKGDIANAPQSGSSERFVLYLPTWVNANTQNIIGFFPLAGANITIR